MAKPDIKSPSKSWRSHLSTNFERISEDQVLQKTSQPPKVPKL
jgi:hypothetical protein